jgi:hypothetical protein
MREPMIDVNHPDFYQLTQRLRHLAQFFNDTSTLLLSGQSRAEQFVTPNQSYLIPVNAQQRIVLELGLQSQVPVGFSLWRVGAEELERLSAGILEPYKPRTVRREVHCDDEGALLMQLVAFEPCSAVSVSISVRTLAPVTAVTPLYRRIPEIFSRLWEPANVPASELVQV